MLKQEESQENTHLNLWLLSSYCPGEVAMDCRVFHQGGANISSKTRVLFNASFQVDESWIECGRISKRLVLFWCKNECKKAEVMQKCYVEDSIMATFLCLPQDVERSESTDSLHELSPKINGFTYHCLPEVAQAAYRTDDLIRLATKT